MVHNIPCFDLPVTQKVTATNYAEASLLDRVMLNKSLREKRQIHISSPIHLWPEDNAESDTPPPAPIEKDEKYKSPVRPRLDMVSVRGQHTVRDLETPLVPDSVEYDNPYSEWTNDGSQYSTSLSIFENSAPSSATAADSASVESDDPEYIPVSWRGKQRRPGVTKIPEDLPCHERYVPLKSSRSTHVLTSQKTLSPCASELPQGDEEQSEWSDCSSVYSQDIKMGYEGYEQEAYPR